jgi:hypothetical protein
MHGDMIGFVAFDFILRLILAGVAGMASVIGIADMDLDDPATDMSSLGIPGNVIADLEVFAHSGLPRQGQTPYHIMRIVVPALFRAMA